MYIKHLCDIFDEVKRVLRKDGGCFVNIGDTYAGGGGWTGVPDDWKSVSTDSKQKRFDHNKKRLSVPDKSLCLIPQRFAIEMVNRGWILRNTLIWNKPNCMPSSARDRFTVDFEPVFFFTKSNKALFWTNSKTGNCVGKQPLGTKGIEGVDWEYREVGVITKDSFNVRVRDTDLDKYGQKASEEEKQGYKKPKLKKVSLWSGHDYWFEQQIEIADTNENRPSGVVRNREYNYQGKYKINNPLPNGNKLYRDNHNKDRCGRNGTRNKRAVWIIPTKPFPEAHFAVYPEKLIEPMIKAGCPRYVCKKCGKARVKIIEYKGGTIGKSWHDHSRDLEEGMHQSLGGLDKQGDELYQRIDKGYTDCDCKVGFEGGIVLDPFAGAGTTAVVAKKQGKRYIGIEIKQEYIDMANKRIRKIPETLF